MMITLEFQCLKWIFKINLFQKIIYSFSVHHITCRWKRVIWVKKKAILPYVHWGRRIYGKEENIGYIEAKNTNITGTHTPSVFPAPCARAYIFTYHFHSRAIHFPPILSILMGLAFFFSIIYHFSLFFLFPKREKYFWRRSFQ